MAKLSITNQHDWMRFIAKFADGVTIKCVFSRGGSSVDVAPVNVSTKDISMQLSAILLENEQKARNESGWNLGKFFGIVEEVGKSSQKAEDFIEALKGKLGFKGEVARPDDAPGKAVVTVKQSRGCLINAHFPSGEIVELKVNKSSVSIVMKPDLSGPRDALVKFVFNIKGTQMVDDETLNRVLVEAAEGSLDVFDWVERARDGVSAAMAPKP